jgi:hypothetical protein
MMTEPWASAPGVVPHHLRWFPWRCTLFVPSWLWNLLACRRPSSARTRYPQVSTRWMRRGWSMRYRRAHPIDIGICRASQASDRRDVSRKPILVMRVSRDPRTCSSWPRVTMVEFLAAGSPVITRPSSPGLFLCPGLARDSPKLNSD